MKVTNTISIPASKQYLSEAISQLPTNCLFDKGKVGCGGTTIALKNSIPYVIAVPFNSLIDNKVRQYNGLVLGVNGYTSKKEVTDYLESVETPKIMVTYDSIEKLSKWIDT